MPRRKVLREIVLESAQDGIESKEEQPEAGDHPSSETEPGHSATSMSTPAASAPANDSNNANIHEAEEGSKAPRSVKRERTAAQTAALKKANARRLELQNERLNVSKRALKELLDSSLQEHLRSRTKKRVKLDPAKSSKKREFSSEEEEGFSSVNRDTDDNDESAEDADDVDGSYSNRYNRHSRPVGHSRLHSARRLSHRRSGSRRSESASPEHVEQPATASTFTAPGRGQQRGGGQGGGGRQGGQPRGAQGRGEGGAETSGYAGSVSGDGGGIHARSSGGSVPPSRAQTVPTGKSKSLTRDEKLYSMIFHR